MLAMVTYFEFITASRAHDISDHVSFNSPLRHLHYDDFLDDFEKNLIA